MTLAIGAGMNTNHLYSLLAVALVLLGTASASAQDEGRAMLARFNTDGSLDVSFDGDGVAMPQGNIGGSEWILNGRYDFSTGKHIAVGYFHVPAGPDSWSWIGEKRFFIGRWNANGTLDKSFSGDGVLVIDFFNSHLEEARAVDIDSSGRLVVVGAVQAEDSERIGVVRVLNDGTLDPSFGGGDGVVVTSYADVDLASAYSVLCDPSGKIWVGGTIARPEPGHNGWAGLMLMARYNSNGTADTSFTVSGAVAYDLQNNLPNFAPEPVVTILYAAGSVLAVTDVFGFPDNTPSYAAVAKVRANSGLDTAYGGGDGVAKLAFANAHFDVRGAIVDGQGRVTMAGGRRSSFDWGETPAFDFALARLTSNGARDNGFSGDGVYTWSNGEDYEALTSIYPVVGSGFVVSGTQGGSLGHSAMWARFDANANRTRTVEPNLTVWGIERTARIAVDSAGRTTVIGTASTAYSPY